MDATTTQTEGEIIETVKDALVNSDIPLRGSYGNIANQETLDVTILESPDSTYIPFFHVKAKEGETIYIDLAELEELPRYGFNPSKLRYSALRYVMEANGDITVLLKMKQFPLDYKLPPEMNMFLAIISPNRQKS